MGQPPIPEATLNEFLRWLIGRRKRLRVTGESMTPTLHEGDLVFVDTRAYHNNTPSPGEILVARHPQQQDLRLIKRVGHITDDERVFLVSDNPRAGTDSRAFGAIGRDRVVGRVVGRIIVS